MAWSGTLVDSKDGVSFTGAVNSDTTPTFNVLGGRYALSIYSSGTASVVLNVKTPSGQFVACGAAVTISALFDLAPGAYQMVLGGSASTADGSLTRVPFRGA